MNKKRLILTTLVVVLASLGVGALMIATGIIGYFWGFSKGLIQGNQMGQAAALARAATQIQGDTESPPPGPSGSGPRPAPLKGDGVTTANQKLARVPLQILRREILPSLPNMGSGSTPSERPNAPGLSIEDNLTQLEKTISQILPGNAEVDTQPPKEVYDAVLVATDDSNAAVSGYLKKVRILFNAEGHSSLVSVTQSMSAPDESAVKKSLNELQHSFEEMKKMEVPPRCKDLHARYLFLLPELISLFQSSQAANQEGDVGMLIDALSRGRKIIALQREIQRMENNLEHALKG